MSGELGDNILNEDPEVISLPEKVEEQKHREEFGQNETTNRQKDVAEDEWGEYEYEKKRDYSGLKIQNLQIQEEEENEEYYGEEVEVNEEGEALGPWNISSIEVSSNVQVNETATLDILVNTTKGVYIPPSKRSNSANVRNKKEKGAVLDYSNQEYFPTLTAAVSIEQHVFKVKKFEQQERGFIEQKPGRSQSNRNVSEQKGTRLNLGNKFNALSQCDN